MGWHDVAQICLNGHKINSSFKRSPQFNKKFCDKCGAKTIIECPKCNFEIKGEYHLENILVISSKIFPVPSFCINCGSPYPWTEVKIEAAKELVKELELSKEDKEKLSNSIDNIVRDTPKTEVSVIKFKKLMSKVGSGFSEMFRNLLIDIVSETVKKMLWPDNK